MTKRSIDFTKERMEKINRGIDLMGIRGLYGEIPKAIDFWVTMGLKYAEFLAKVTPDLNHDEMRYLFQSVAKLKQEQKDKEKAIEKRLLAENVTPDFLKK